MDNRYRVNDPQPEVTQAPSPPAMAGESMTPTKLHALRLRQLQDLAKAYEIALPTEATKTQILPFMIAAEQAGQFRSPPKHPYHYLHAQMNHDSPLAGHERDEFFKRLKEAEA